MLIYYRRRPVVKVRDASYARAAAIPGHPSAIMDQLKREFTALRIVVTYVHYGVPRYLKLIINVYNIRTVSSVAV